MVTSCRFPTEKEFNGLYLLYANIDAPTVKTLTKEVYTGGYESWLWYYLMTYFNSYIAVRILPHQDYTEYLDHHHSEREEVTFEVLKKKIFDNYDLLYPAMSRIFPFDEKVVRSYQDHLYQLMSFDNWHNSSYMPVSRDLLLSNCAFFGSGCRKTKEHIIIAATPMSPLHRTRKGLFRIVDILFAIHLMFLLNGNNTTGCSW